jgi:hypothetical protein
LIACKDRGGGVSPVWRHVFGEVPRACPSRPFSARYRGRVAAVSASFRKHFQGCALALEHLRRMPQFGQGSKIVTRGAPRNQRRKIMTKLNLAITVCVAGLAMAPAFAQEVADADGNGTYSMEELVAAYPDLTAEVFTTVDANADGAVDATELKAAQDAGTLKAS